VIVINPFARRQTAESAFSHFQGNEEQLLARIQDGFPLRRGGLYREGLVAVPVNPDGFFSPVVILSPGQTLQGEFVSRVPGEDPRQRVWAPRSEGVQKSPAVAVDVILYPSSILAEDGSNTLPPEEGNYEVISINARTSRGAEPIHPDTLMANHFQESGGTASSLSAEEFVEQLRVSRAYWKGRALLGPPLSQH